MELFDLVDAEDRVIGVTNKSEAHSQRLLHRMVAIFVFNAQGELYVQIHKASGGLFDHSVGGHVSQGESYIFAAQREGSEELGLNQPLEEISVFYSKERKYDHMIGLFACVAGQDWKFLPSEEVAEIIPMSLGYLRERMMSTPEIFTGGFINTMQEYCRAKGI